ncbi:MAG: AraC family transcriptional regulator [Clostridiales bacterium]|nr:AraC family transcriptional regulator [Clostridiales bacterium]
MDIKRKIYYDPIDYIYASCREYKEPKYMIGQHYHNAYEVYFVGKGKKRLFINNVPYVLEAGELIVISPYAVHYTEDTGPFSNCVVCFSNKLLRPFLSEDELAALFRGVNEYKFKFDEEMIRLIEICMREIERHTYNDEILSDKLAFTYIIQLINLLRTAPAQCREHLKQERYFVRPDIINSIEYMHERYMTDISLKDMLEYIHMSKSRFSELFKEATQMTFLQYLNLIRSSHAGKMLRRTKLSLPEIADRNGFSSPAHMSRVFKEIYGISPSKYRSSFVAGT